MRQSPAHAHETPEQRDQQLHAVRPSDRFRRLPMRLPPDRLHQRRQTSWSRAMPVPWSYPAPAPPGERVSSLRRASRPTGSISASTRLSKRPSRFVRRPDLPIFDGSETFGRTRGGHTRHMLCTCGDQRELRGLFGGRSKATLRRMSQAQTGRSRTAFGFARRPDLPVLAGGSVVPAHPGFACQARSSTSRIASSTPRSSSYVRCPTCSPSARASTAPTISQRT